MIAKSDDFLFAARFNKAVSVMGLTVAVLAIGDPGRAE
jgi:hypothetical protein